MARPIPQPARTIMAVARLLTRLRLIPLPQQVLSEPHSARLAKTHPWFFGGRDDLGVRTWNDTVAGRGGPIPIRIYARPDLRPGAPAVLFIHGGGFVNGGLDFADNIQRGLAARTGYLVVGISYRLAPEFPFPAALHDCQDVLQWMVDTRPHGLDPQRIGVGGESAGGNLAAALTIANRDGARHPIRHQVIIYPFTDTTLTSPDWDASTMPGGDRAAAERMVHDYAGENKDEPLISVLHADHAGLPPAMVISCEHDPLRTDSIRYAEALLEAGVPTRHRHYDNMPHAYLVMPGIIAEAETSLDEIAREITEQLGPAMSLNSRE
ncbi:alpha/beta hydrolase [Nocardia jejuensis]|uniref:alpha/beta hydrolase n=1 Tax=Nocardia jejuensis TaxID=328049 RepID=UPI00083445EB|nr:alpha/beta hydrolase [Nocardia jejuensis]